MSASRVPRRIRKPVRREAAAHYLELALLSFAASVGCTRLFLQLSGYPQIGGGGLHIAHVLWGGLLLFAAALLPLILANRWVYPTSAIVAGIGVGLFIDEVGKFITQNNNYFYPAAAPIIYALFLLTVLLYLEVRRPATSDARTELYMALEGLEDVLDHDLTEEERADIDARLRLAAAATDQPELARLGQELLHFLRSEAVLVQVYEPGFFARVVPRMDRWEARWIGKGRLRAGLAGGLVALGAYQIAKLVPLLTAWTSPQRLTALVARMAAAGRIASASGLAWFAARLALEGTVGLLILTAGVLLAVRLDRRGAALGRLGLLLALTTVDILLFYFDQFSTTLVALVQFTLLLGVLHFRRRYLGAPGMASGTTSE